MAGSTFGELFRVTTYGESHGAALGAVVDGVPAGITIDQDYIQKYLDRRKPGQSEFTTARKESDSVEILSGVFEGKTEGTPVGLLIRNEDQRSRDYGNIMDVYRPGHADYTFDQKYGFRDYRGGGRSSGRETAARVAAGAVAMKFLEDLGITIQAYSRAIGPFTVADDQIDIEESRRNSLCLPDRKIFEEASEYCKELIEKKDSAGGIIECRIQGLPAGLGETVFDKYDALLSQAIMSIGAVKGFEIGEGFRASTLTGSSNNDPFAIEGNCVAKTSNHSGGVLGGMTDGSTVTFRAAVKPTPSIAQSQHTVDRNGAETDIVIKGRHDPLVVPRAVVVVEAMAALTTADLLLRNMTARMDRIRDFYSQK